MAAFVSISLTNMWSNALWSEKFRGLWVGAMDTIRERGEG